MLIAFARTLILYLFVVLVMRLMGKREIGQLQPFELAIAIMISELAAIPMGDKDIPLLDGIVPILTLLLAQLILSYASMRSPHIRTLTCGKPSILIEKGRIVEEELANSRLTINDLLEQLRAKSFPNIADVEYAILETNGQLSVIPKTTRRPVCPQDMNIYPEYEGLPQTVISEGRIQDKNLKKAGIDRTWLMQQLAMHGINNPDEVFYANVDGSKKLFVQKKQNNEVK